MKEKPVMSSFLDLDGDLQESLLCYLNARDLNKLALSCKALNDARKRVRRFPQWVGSLSILGDAEQAANEAVNDAVGQLRNRPDVAFVFVAPGYYSVETAVETIKARLGSDVKVCGCTGAAIIGTPALGASSSKLSPKLVEEGPALSLTLAYFADQCDVSVRFADISNVSATRSRSRSNTEFDMDFDGLVSGPGEQQLITFMDFSFGDYRLKKVIARLSEDKGKTVVFGGIASGRHAYGEDVRMISTQKCFQSGCVICVLSPKPGGPQLDAVVVPGASLVGNPIQVRLTSGNIVSHITGGHEWSASCENEVGEFRTMRDILTPYVNESAINTAICICYAESVDTLTGQLMEPIDHLDFSLSVERQNGDVRITYHNSVAPRLKEGSFIQLEINSAEYAGPNVLKGLVALALETNEKIEEKIKEKITQGKASSQAKCGISLARSASRVNSARLAEAEFSAGGGLLFSCLGRSSGWYEEKGLSGQYEPSAFASAFPGKPLAGFLAQGEIFGEFSGGAITQDLFEQDFVHGYTAVYAVSGATCSR